MRVLLVDDHSLIRTGIMHSLCEHYPAISVFEADSSAAALALTQQQQQFDLAIIDLFIPGEKLSV
ncbi:MAG: response regulator [Halioglobus sp.]